MKVRPQNLARLQKLPFVLLLFFGFTAFSKANAAKSELPDNLIGNYITHKYPDRIEGLGIECVRYSVNDPMLCEEAHYVHMVWSKKGELQSSKGISIEFSRELFENGLYHTFVVYHRLREKYVDGIESLPFFFLQADAGLGYGSPIVGLALLPIALGLDIVTLPVQLVVAGAYILPRLPGAVKVRNTEHSFQPEYKNVHKRIRVSEEDFEFFIRIVGRIYPEPSE